MTVVTARAGNIGVRGPSPVAERKWVFKLVEIRRIGTLTVGMIATVALSAGLAVAAPPANDNFLSAQEIVGEPMVQVESTNVDATAEAGEPVHFDGASGNSVWFRFRAATSGQLAFDTCPVGSTLYTGVMVYEGNRLDSLTPLPWDGPPVGCAAPGGLHLVAVEAGHIYRVVVDGRVVPDSVFTGEFRLRVIGDVTLQPIGADPAFPNTFTFRKLVRKFNGTAIVRLKTPWAGRLQLVGNGKVKAFSRKVGAPSVGRLNIRPKGKLKKKLAKKGKASVKVTFRFTPTGGVPRTMKRKLVLRKG